MLHRTAAIAFLMLALPLLAGASDEELLATDASWNALRLAADVEKLDAILADDWMLTHSDGRVQSKPEYLGELRTRSRTNEAITNDDVKLRRYGDTAVVTGTSVQSGVSDGKPWSGKFRFTRVWVRRDGRWTMVASHSSRIERKP